MTIKKQVICDGCGIEVKEQDVYSVVMSEPPKFMGIVKFLSEEKTASHFCGQECLMKHIANNLVCL